MARKFNISHFFGIMFVIGSIWLAVKGVSIYREQLDQRDWTVHTAVVTNVKSRIETSVGKHPNFSVTVYDIDYEYDVGGIIYTGRIVGNGFYKSIGDSFSIKYDPDAPENSTDILEPQPDALIYNFAGAGIFMVIGVYCSRLYELIPKRKKKTEPVKKKSYYIDY